MFFSADGTKVAHIDCCSADRDNDEWNKGSIQTRNMEMRVSKLLIKDMHRGSFLITRNAVGNDDWDFTVKIFGILSDGSRVKFTECSGRNSCSANW